MGNDDQGHFAFQFLKYFAEGVFGFGIQCAGGFIANQYPLVSFAQAATTERRDIPLFLKRGEGGGVKFTVKR